MVEAKKGCKKKSLNIWSLAADLLKCDNVTASIKRQIVKNLVLHFSREIQQMSVFVLLFHGFSD